MLGPSQYRRALEAARDEWHSKNHPFFKSWAAGELAREAMKAYCQQHYNFVSNASRYSGIMYGLCDWHDARVLLLENLNEEEDPVERHVDKLAKFGMALGMTVDEGRAAPDLPTTAALEDFIVNTLSHRSRCRARRRRIRDRRQPLRRRAEPADCHRYGPPGRHEAMVLHGRPVAPVRRRSPVVSRAGGRLIPSVTQNRAFTDAGTPPGAAL